MIYIIRHGQTQLNKAHALQGRSDLPLNDQGRLQAREVMEKLQSQGITFNYCFTSPLIRAMETARILAPGLEPLPEERLIEMDYGPYEGADLTHLPPEVLTFFQDFVHNPAPEGMESLQSVVERVGSFLEEIKTLPGNILLSTHAIAMKGALEYLTPSSKGAYWSKFIGNCALYVSDNSGGEMGVPQELLLS